MKTTSALCFLCACSGVKTPLPDPGASVWLHHAGGSTDCGYFAVCADCYAQSEYLPRELREESEEEQHSCSVCRKRSAIWFALILA
jgi:hypothetical protein